MDRRLVITIQDKTKEFDPQTTRNAINQKLLAKGFSDPVVTTVNKSHTGERVIITTMPKYKNDVLLEHKSEWETIVDIVNMQKDANWVKIIAHNIDIATFSGDNKMKLLKSEVEIFNPGLILALKPIWLTKQENRILKKHSSIILTVKSKEDARIAINQGLYIASDHVTVSE